MPPTGRASRHAAPGAPTAGYLGANQVSIDTATLYGGTLALSAAVEDTVRADPAVASLVRRPHRSSGGGVVVPTEVMRRHREND